MVGGLRRALELRISPPVPFPRALRRTAPIFTAALTGRCVQARLGGYQPSASRTACFLASLPHGCAAVLRRRHIPHGALPRFWPGCCRWRKPRSGSRSRGCPTEPGLIIARWVSEMRLSTFVVPIVTRSLLVQLENALDVCMFRQKHNEVSNWSSSAVRKAC